MTLIQLHLFLKKVCDTQEKWVKLDHTFVAILTFFDHTPNGIQISCSSTTEKYFHPWEWNDSFLDQILVHDI